MRNRKHCTRWLPWLLTIDQKRICVTISEKNLAYFNRNPKEFLRLFVTMDKIWIPQETQKSLEGSKQWVKPGESAQRRPKTQQSAGKVMASVLWEHYHYWQILCCIIGLAGWRKQEETATFEEEETETLKDRWTCSMELKGENIEK